MAGSREDEYLAVAPHLTVHKAADNSFFLLSETQTYHLQDAAYAMILPLLDGRFRMRDIVAQLAGRMTEQEVTSALSTMMSKGYVVKVDPWADTARSAFWSADRLHPQECEKFMQSYKVAVVSLGRDGAAGSVQAAGFSAMLTAQGFTVTDYPNAHLAIVLVEDYLQPGLADFARIAARRKLRWLPFKPGGRNAWFGPLIGEEGAAENCYFCLARRLAEHRPDYAIIAPQMEGTRPARAATPATLAVAFGRAVLEINRFAMNQADFVRRQLTIWSLVDGKQEGHNVPLFEDCAEHAQFVPARDPDQMHRPIKLSAVHNHTGADGGWRALSPEQALAKLEPIVSPVTGIVSVIQPVKLPEGLHVYTASQGNRVSIDPRQNRTLGKPGGAAGKGLSDAQARISCLAEAVERYSAQWTGTETRHRARWQDIRDHAPHPGAFLQFSDHQYQNRHTLNEGLGMMGRIPEPFDETAEIDWVPAWSLRDHAPRWLPARFCYYEYPGGAPGDHKFCWADSNGCATGGSIEEAILQGFLEVVERDAISIWWYNRIVPPRLSLDGLDDDYVARIRDFYQSRGRDIWLLDITTDIGIPVVVALSATHDGKRVLSGFGAHVDGKIAALRALTEINQVLMLDSAPDANEERAKNHMVEDALWQWLDQATLEDHPYLAGRDVGRTAEDMPNGSFDTIDQAVQFCVDRVAEAGFDTIVVDYSRTDLPLSCVRVVVPGLRHFWNRRAPGRLFEAPVAMGALDQPRNPEDLNPLNFFL